MELDFQPTPHAEAAAMIAGKPVVTREVFDQMLPELRGRAFTITGVEGANVMQRVRDSIAGLATGGEDNTWDKIKQEVVAELETYLGDGAERRAELLLRTHGFQAFQASNYRVIQADEDTTHIQYLTMEDENVRDSHAALDGVVLPKDDPFWDSHTPPWDWGCRCRIRPMNPDLVDLERVRDEQRNPEDHLVIEGAELDQLRHGTIISDGQRVDVTPPSERRTEGAAFQWHPDDLRLPVEELEQRYDPPVWDAFKQFAQSSKLTKTQTLWQWLRPA